MNLKETFTRGELLDLADEAIRLGASAGAEQDKAINTAARQYFYGKQLAYQHAASRLLDLLNTQEAEA